MKYGILSFACASAAIALASPAAASVVYQSVADDSAANVVGAYCADCSYYQAEVVDQFTLSNAASINGVNLWIYASGGYDIVTTTGYTFNVYDSTRENLLFSQLVMPITTYDTRQGIMSIEMKVGGALTGLDLAAGTYWAGFRAPTLGVMSFGGGNASLLQVQGGSASSRGDNAGYQLTASDEQNANPAVPEPASWAMMVGGFGLIGAAMRHRRTTVTYA